MNVLIHTPARPARQAAQRGAVLMIGMVMMLMLTLVAIGLIRLSMRHTQVVNNEQVRTEAVTAANFALDTVLNKDYDAGNWPQYAGNTGATVSVNLGLSQAADASAPTVSVKVSHLTQRRCRKLLNRELFEPDGTLSASNRTCISGGGSGGLFIGGGTGGRDSNCSTVLWEMQAEVDTAATPAMLNATTPVVQGVEQKSAVDCS
jgi:hypothetical protein